MTISIPTLYTDRLILRPFKLNDAKDIQRLAGHPLIYATTASIPHPYPDGAAEEWMSHHQKWFEEGHAVQLAIALKTNNALIGNMSLFGISKVHRRAEIGYWVAVDHWSKGYATEAAREMIRYGFQELDLNRIHGRHVKENIASEKVMSRLGMRFEGTARQEFFRGGTFFDISTRAILREDWRINADLSQK